jgi:hypothetical protein
MDPYLHGAISFPHEWDALVKSSVPPEHQEELGAVVHLFQFVAFQVAAAEKRHRNLQWENDVLRRKLAGKEGDKCVLAIAHIQKGKTHLVTQ